MKLFAESEFRCVLVLVSQLTVWHLPASKLVSAAAEEEKKPLSSSTGRQLRHRRIKKGTEKRSELNPSMLLRVQLVSAAASPVGNFVKKFDYDQGFYPCFPTFFNPQPAKTVQDLCPSYSTICPIRQFLASDKNGHLTHQICLLPHI